MCVCESESVHIHVGTYVFSCSWLLFVPYHCARELCNTFLHSRGEISFSNLNNVSRVCAGIRALSVLRMHHATKSACRLYSRDFFFHFDY